MFSSIASINLPLILIGYAASISRIQVGLVTLISVTLSPITSNPTKYRPRFFNSGAIVSAINLSVALSGLASPLPPAAKLPRVSPCAGIHRLAIHNKYSFVAIFNFGHKFLHHGVLITVVG